MNSEQDILLKIKQGNLLAFEKLYNEMQPRLYAFTRKFFVNQELAKDLVQDVFYDFWKNSGNIMITTSISSYLFKMVQNRCLNYLRELRIHNKYSNYVEIKLKEAEVLFFDQDYSGYHSIFFEDIKNILQIKIDELPDACREIFILSRYEGYSNKEISERLNISLRTVENQVYRALKVLKEGLKDYLVLFPFFLAFFEK